MIKQRACNDELLLLEAKDYKHQRQWLVIYGLSVTPCLTLEEAHDEFLACYQHWRNAEGC